MQKETWILVPSFSDVASVSLMRCTTYRVVASYGVLLQAVEDTGAPMGNAQTRFGSDVPTLLDNLKITFRILGALKLCREHWQRLNLPRTRRASCTAHGLKQSISSIPHYA